MAVGRVKGIGDLKADVKSKTLSIEYDPSDVTVEGVQQALADLGYDAGTPDGVVGPNTVASVRRYQGDHGLLMDGRVTPELATHIEAQEAQRNTQAGGG